MKYGLFTLTLACSFLTGCAPVLSGAMNAATTDSSVMTKTAQYFGTEPGSVQVSNIKKNLLTTTYQARHGGKFYNCRVYYGEVDCKQPGS